MRGSKPGGEKRFSFLHASPDRLWYPSNRGSFPGVKRPWREIGHLLHLASKVKNDRSHASAPLLRLEEKLRGTLHIYTFIPLHLYTFTPLHLYTFTPLHLYTFTHLHLYTFTHLHLYTFTPLHLYTFTPFHPIV